MKEKFVVRFKRGVIGVHENVKLHDTFTVPTMFLSELKVKVYRIDKDIKWRDGLRRAYTKLA